MSDTAILSRGLPAIIREGEVLGGKYRLEREIGRGAMGTVWSAVHLTLGQRVAIKLISAEHAQSPEARTRFSVEAKAAARLRSRYVVQVYDDGETPAGTPFIVLEYLEGETLEQRLEREHDVPLNDAVRITRHVARALSRAHAHGIVHRDLKPANVFLTRSDDDEFGWVAKVLDFGIAKLLDHGVASTTKTGTLLGTPVFMSPEHVRGASSVDGRSDLYSLGLVFYNMLTGKLAFDGDSFADVAIAICNSPLPDIRSVAPWIPASISDWFQRACARDPQARFQSADELVEGLDLALGLSVGSYGRPSQGDPRLDTLRGHAPPVAHSVARSSAPDFEDFGKGATQVLITDPLLLKSNHGASARTLDPEPTVPTASRMPLVVGAAIVLCLLAGGVLLIFARGKVPPVPVAAVSANPVSAESNSAPLGARAAPIQATPRDAVSALAASAEPGATVPATRADPGAGPEAAKVPGTSGPGGAGSQKSAARPLPTPPSNAQKTRPNPGHASGAGPAPRALPSRNTPTDIGF